MIPVGLLRLPLAGTHGACGSRNDSGAPIRGKTVAPVARFTWPNGGGAYAAPHRAGPGFAEPAGERPITPGQPAGPSADATAAPGLHAAAVRALVGRPLAVIEREVCEATITHCRGSVPRAAVMLGISPSTLYRKLAAWGGSGRNP